MALFGRRPTHDVRDRPIDPAELRRAVDDGFLIAKSAVTIAVANHIITNALRDGGYFDHGVISDVVRDELHRMADEQRGDADRVRDIRAKALRQTGRSRHQHDYRRGDDLKLRTREATYVQLAEMLDEKRSDAAFVDGVVLVASARAWDDIGSAVIGRLGWAQRPTAGYEIGRDDRLRRMLDEDFAALLAEHPMVVNHAVGDSSAGGESSAAGEPEGGTVSDPGGADRGGASGRTDVQSSGSGSAGAAS